MEKKKRVGRGGEEEEEENWDKPFDKIRWKFEREREKTGKTERTQTSLDGFVSKKGGIIVAWNGQM